jgi:hypothetical protein
MSYSYQSHRARVSLMQAALLAVVVLSVTACGGTSAFGPAISGQPFQAAGQSQPANSSSWNFTTLNNPDDKNYNELLGINNIGRICGFDGKGDRWKPSKGYCIQDYGKSTFRNENYPGAVDTFVTSLNSAKSIAGYYVTPQRWIFGFIYTHGIWTSYKDPELRKGTSNITELLGISQSGLAVGFYRDEKGIDHGFELDEATGKYHAINPPGGVTSEATGINGKGDVVGWMQTAKGTVVGYLLKGGSFTVYAYPHAAITKPWGINWQDQIVGQYTDSGAPSDPAPTHGFVYTDPLTKPYWASIDEPNANGYTVLTSIQDSDYMVGYYRGADGKHTNGFLASPK